MEQKCRNCALFANEIVYLGRIIKADEAGVADHTTDAICSLPEKATITKVRSFLG